MKGKPQRGDLAVVRRSVISTCLPICAPICEHCPQRTPPAHTMKGIIWFLVGMLVGRGDTQLYPNPMCTTDPSATVSPTDSRLPIVLPPQFQVHIEATFVNEKRSLTADEYVDTSAGMSALTVRSMGMLESFILSADTNETFHLTDGSCDVHNAVTDKDDVFMGAPGDSHMKHTYSTSSVLKFLTKYGQVYKGITAVRGIDTDHWQSCVYWDFLNVNFTLDYYFTRPNWTTADGSMQLPVRAEVQGYNNILGPGPGSSFHHIYDYVGFQSFVSDNTVFETPRGYICKGRKSTRQIPKLKPFYQYREEITAIDQAVVTMTDIWYDFNYQLVRYDYRPVGYLYPTYSMDLVSEIHDFNTGVSYIIDKNLKNCTFIPIENTTWDATHNVSRRGGMALKKPEQLFYLNGGSFEYSGQRTVRGMTCDVFGAIRNDFPDGGLLGLNVTFEVYFLSKDWTSVTSVGSDTASDDVPVRLEIYEATTGFDVMYDFYNFDQENPNVANTFDISPCFDDQQKLDFQITFPGDAKDFLYQWSGLVQELAIAQLAKATTISPIRFQHVQIHGDEDNVYLMGTMIDKVPALTKFRRFPSLVASYNDDIRINDVPDVYTCAASCDNQQGTCNSFDFCPGAQTCAESQQYTSDGSKLSQNKNCDHFSRVLSGAVEHELSLHDAYELLKDTVYTGNFLLSVINQASDLNRAFKALDITTDVLRDPSKGSVNKAAAMTKFNSQSGKVVKGFNDEILTGMAIDGCAAQCLSNMEFTCESFEYCLSNGNCILSRILPDERPDLIQANASCDLYSRDYTSRFSEMVGTTVLSNSDTIYQNIKDPNQCAKMCYDYESFSCKSFDYCPDISACFLGHTHVLDLPKANIKQSPECNHFSINYADDFKVTANKQIKLKDNRIVMGITVEQCAKLCVEEETFSCASFDYCGNTTECRLSEASMSDIGQVTLEATAYCSIYNRQYYPNGKTYVAHVDTSAKYTAGAMGGLGFAMLIVGLLIGVGLLFAWTKYRGGPQDDMAVSFSNKDTLSVN